MCTPGCGAHTCSPTTTATSTRATSKVSRPPISTLVGMRRRRQLVQALSLATVLAFVAACAPGLPANPRYATDSGAHPQGAPQTTKPPTGPPPIEAPKNDLSWRDCTSRVFSEAAVQAIPGVKLDCASYDA